MAMHLGNVFLSQGNPLSETNQTKEKQMKTKQTKNANLKTLFNSYEGNLLNYFAGMTPNESKKFNATREQMKANAKQR